MQSNVTIAPHAKKVYKIKPTLRQKRVAKNLLDNHGSAYKAIEKAGYSKNVAKNPKEVLESKGFRMIADEIGLTDSFILKCLSDDIEAKPRNRLGELTLASKIKGLTSENNSGNVTNVLILPQELIRKHKPQE